MGEEVSGAEKPVVHIMSAQSSLFGVVHLASIDLAALDTMDFTYTVIGSAGITGKSSGEGKCVRPKVCHNTTSSLSRLADGLAEIQAGRPWEGSPEVCGTWRPAGWSWESSSVD